MAEISKYTWIVTQGAIVGDSSGMVGQIGPPDGKKHARFDLVIREGKHFRLTDEQGNLRYSGYIVGEYGGFEPLDEYGIRKGCTTIEYERGGQWSSLVREGAPLVSNGTNATEQYSGTKPVPPNLRFDEAKVSAYLHDHVEGFEGPFAVNQFRGGQSNPTYLIEARSGQYVMRRKPPGVLLPSAHAVDREYRVCKALYSIGFPVPRPYCLCEDEGVAGTIFYVMEFVRGRVFWDGSLPGETPVGRRAIYDAFSATLASLHNVDYEGIGLGDFGRPGNYFARQISRWSKQFVASRTESVETMDRLMDWLPKNIPPEDSVSLVHGDFSLHNVMFHPSEPRVIAVLDWEISTIGHPLADLTYNMLAWYAPSTPGAIGSLEGLDLESLGIPTMDQYLARYCELTGRGGVERMDYYRAYNLFRLAAILQGIVGRVRDGTASNENAEAMAAHVKPLSEIAWRFAQQAGAR